MKVKPTKTSVEQFQLAIRRFQRASSETGTKIGKAEVSKALDILTKNGKVSAAERKAAADVLAKAPLTRAAKEALQTFVDAQAPARPQNRLSDESRAQILSQFNKIDRAGLVEWRAGDALPLGPAYHREELMRERHPDGFKFTVIVPAGNLDPRHPGETDPNKAKKFFIERSGGIAGLTQVAGPFTKEAIQESTDLKPEIRDAILRSFNKANTAGTVQWRGRDAMPVGPRYHREVLSREGHPDGFTYTALIPAGSLNPRFGGGDPNAAKTYFVERSGGFAGLTQVAGPFNITAKEPTARDIKKLYADDVDLRQTLFAATFPRYTRSAPPVVEDVKKLDEGRYEVTVQLVNFMTRVVEAEKKVIVDADGQPEVRGGRVTTLAVGEEGGGAPGGGGGRATTMAVGEEGGGGFPGGGATTLAMGEEGGGAITLAIPEN